MLERRLRAALRRLGRHAELPEAPAHGDEGDISAGSHERDLAGATRAIAERVVEECEAALDRIADGTWGRCETCGGEIPAPRLRVQPEASECVPCATRREQAIPRARGRSFDEEEDDE
jgi:DnaK suppressor protein